VVIAVFNGERFLAQAIESVLAQMYPNVETILVDDGSTDATPQVTLRFGDRIRYVRQQNQGAAAARNKAISLARGDLVAFLDHDDLWRAEKLEKQVGVFLEEPSADVCFTHFQNVNEEGIALPGGESREKARTLRSLMEHGRPLKGGGALLPMKDFLMGLMKLPLVPTPSGVMVRKAALAEIGGFDLRKGCAEDWDLWLRLAVRHPFAYIPDVLYHYRHHSRQLTQQGTQVLDSALVVAEACLRSPEMRRRIGCKVILSRLASLHDRCATVLAIRGEMRKARVHYLAALRARPKSVSLVLWAATFCAPITARLLDWRQKGWDETDLSENQEDAGR